MTTRGDRNTEADREARYSRTDGAGAFDIDILNTLGRDQKAARNILYQQALEKPEAYLKKRNKAMDDLIDSEVRSFYLKFKKLLKSGEYGTGGQLELPLSTDPYRPMLPDATIQKFCIGVAESIEDICEKAFEEIYPVDHKNLAIKKMTELNKTGGLP